MTTIELATWRARSVRFGDSVKDLAALRARVAQLESQLARQIAKNERLAAENKAALKSWETRWRHAFTANPTGTVPIAKIAALVCLHYGVPLAEVCSDRRKGQVAIPRYVAMYIAKTLTLKSYPVIGRFFNKDHSSVIKAVKKITQLRADDREFDAEIKALMAELSNENPLVPGEVPFQ